MSSPSRLTPSHLQDAFQDLCETFPKGVFYRRGSFIAFEPQVRQRWLTAVAERQNTKLDVALGHVMGLMQARGFLGDAPASASGRVADINCFRQLLGALMLGMEAMGRPSAPLEESVAAWFEAPPYWLLASFGAEHLARLNPPMARRAAKAAPPKGQLPPRTVDQLAQAARAALGPLLRRRHGLFWYDPDTRQTFIGKPPEGGYPKAHALKVTHTEEETTRELDALKEALQARAPHNVNALVFHLLAAIAWSEPVERSPGRPNPGFEPLRHFFEQLCVRKARWLVKRLPQSGSADVQELTLELMADLILMCQADRFRPVININASVRAALDRSAKGILEGARKAHTAAPVRTDAPMDWLVARLGAEQAQRLQGTLQLEAKAELRQALTGLWTDLRQNLARWLEESSPERIHLSSQLLETYLSQAPPLIVALSQAPPEVVVRWYLLDALGLDEAELQRELNMRRLWLGDADNQVWLEHMTREATSLKDHRQHLDTALTQIIAGLGAI